MHSGEYHHDSTLQVAEQMALTATVDILQDIAKGAGPRRSLLALGYAGWGPGQLDAELARGSWHVVNASEELVFSDSPETIWRRLLPPPTYQVFLGHSVTLLTGEETR